MFSKIRDNKMIHVLSRFPSFLFLSISNSLQFLCRMTDNTLIGWLVLEITNSSTLVGVMNSIRMLPTMLGMIGGAGVDRLDRRKLLFSTQALSLVLFLLTGTIIISGFVQFWQLILITLLSGLTFTFGMPTIDVLTANIVGESHLTNAVALRSLMMYFASVIGPSLVAMLFGWLGTGNFYYFLSVIMVVSLLLILKVREPPSTLKTKKQISMWRDLVDGFHFIRNNRTIFVIFVLVIIQEIFGYGYITLMPVFARDVLNVGATGLAWLTSMRFLGAFICGIALAFFGGSQRRGLLFILADIFWGLTLLLFAFSSYYPLSLIWIFGVGISSSMSMMLVQTLLLAYTPNDKQGKILGVRMTLIATDSASHFCLGRAAEIIGAPLTLGINSALFSLSSIVILLVLPRLRKLN